MYAEILSNLVISKVRFVSTIYTPQNTRVKRQDRKLWAIVIKYEGETVYTANGKQFVSDLNHMVILPKGCSYAWKCTKAGHYAILEFESEQTYPEPLSFFVKNSEKILKIFKELEHSRNLNRPLTELQSIRDAYAMILLLAQSQDAQYYPTEKQRKIAPAMEYISRNYNRDITNDALAAQTGLSTVYFRKLFTRILGVSPIAYVHQLRIQKAREMLGSDYGTLTDMAQALGYPSLYDFSRDFKKHTGVCPSKYEASLFANGD